MQILTGLLLAGAISFTAYRAQSLTYSGALAATAIGFLVFGVGGWNWALPLLGFFAASTLLTRAFDRRKARLSEKYAKGSRRDAGQVLGNGGIAALFALLHGIFPHASWPALAYSAALAAVNADTWATELGVLAPTPPRLIANLGRTVEPGTSGGVSWLGILAATLGASTIASLVAVSFPLASATLVASIAVGGLLGSLFDSLLGATVQASYWCPAEGKETEKHPLHSCGTPTVHIRGWRWLDNDLVNAACSGFGVLATFVIASILGGI